MTATTMYVNINKSRLNVLTRSINNNSFRRVNILFSYSLNFILVDEYGTIVDDTCRCNNPAVDDLDLFVHTYTGLQVKVIWLYLKYGYLKQFIFSCREFSKA